MNLAEQFIGELSQEAVATRRVLERVPEEKLGWRPHPRSLSLGQLAFHVANVPGAIANLVSDPVREVPNVPRPEAKSVAELLSTLDASIAAATARLSAWDDAALATKWKMVREGRTLLELPRGAMLRAAMLNHWYHHRGQLTVYLRLLDVPLPAIYGDSADEVLPGRGPKELRSDQ